MSDFTAVGSLDFPHMEAFVDMGDFLEADDDNLYRSLREYSRVEAFLPVRIRRVSQEERQTAISRIVIESALAEHPEMPELEAVIKKAKK